MTGTKTLRYDTTVLDARALADALEAEEKAGWEVAEAAYDGTDFVVTFEREGALTLVDEDTVSESNINRQCCALHSTVGLSKAEVMAARVRDINPGIAVDARTERYEAATRERFFDTEYDYIADCIDLVSCKVDLIRTAHARGIPIVSALGTGNKADASRFELCDISRTSGCPFARVMRRELRSAGITHHAVVFSPEPAMTPEALCAPPPGRRSVPGSLPWVPASAGLLMAQKIVLDLCAAQEARI